MSIPTPINPYEAPESEGYGAETRLVVPESFLGKLAMGFRLLFGNLVIIAPLVLVIWLPANFAIETLVARSATPDDPMAALPLDNIVEVFFGPLISGAVISLLAERFQGRKPRVIEVVRSGLQSWGPLFLTRLVVGIILMLGLIALVVPGIVLAVRYAMVDEVVVLEGAGVTVARRRSSDLSRGRGRLIFFSGLIYLTVLLLIGTGIAFAQELLPGTNTLGMRVGAQSLLNVLSHVITCVMFLYYWEAYAKDQSFREAEAFGNVDDLTWLSKRNANDS